jgi:hypothetical protein
MIDEANIQTTIVLLKAMRDGGRIKTPPSVELAALNPEEGWRYAALKYLEEQESRKQRQDFRPRPTRSLTRTEGEWQELNERWNWEEARERAG